MYKEIDGDLIKLAKQGSFDVIAHGCNCFCRMGAGIAPQMAKAFKCDRYPLESRDTIGDINKLGQIDYEAWYSNTAKIVYVINAYTQYDYKSLGNEHPLDYEALQLCLRKMSHQFSGYRIGLPKIGCGLAGGDWQRVKQIIQTELKDCNVTVVNYKP